MDEGVGLGVWILDFGFGFGLSLCLHLFYVSFGVEDMFCFVVDCVSYHGAR